MKNKIIALGVIALALPVQGLLADAKAAPKPVAQKAKTLNVRYMDLSAAMGSSAEGQKVSASLEKTQEKLAKRVQDKQQAYTQAATEYRSKESTLSPEARNKEQQRIVRLEADYKNELQACENEFKLVVQQETEKIGKQVEKAVQAVAKSDNLDAVVDKLTGRVLYTSDKADCTKEIVELMNKQYSDVLAKNTKAPSQKARA